MNQKSYQKGVAYTKVYVVKKEKPAEEEPKTLSKPKPEETKVPAEEIFDKKAPKHPKNKYKNPLEETQEDPYRYEGSGKFKSDGKNTMNKNKGGFIHYEEKNSFKEHQIQGKEKEAFKNPRNYDSFNKDSGEFNQYPSTKNSKKFQKGQNFQGDYEEAHYKATGWQSGKYKDHDNPFDYGAFDEAEQWKGKTKSKGSKKTRDYQENYYEERLLVEKKSSKKSGIATYEPDNREKTFGNQKKDKFIQKKSWKNQRGRRTDRERREVLFADFIEKIEVEEGLKNKTLYEGVFLTNENVRQLATIKCEIFEDKIFIQSLESQNRALHGSVVIFRLIENPSSGRKEHQKQNSKNKEESKELQGKNKKRTDKKKVEEVGNEAESKKEQSIEIAEASEWETEEEITETTEKKENVKEDEESKKEESPIAKKYGEVVFIMKNDYLDRDIIGKIENVSEKKHYKSGKQKPNYVFVPNEKKLPRMFIKDMGQEVYDLIEKDPDLIENSYLIGRLLEWPAFSFYPHIHVTGVLGREGEIEIECKALLLENKVFLEDFQEKTLESLSQYQDGEWEIPADERLKRLDLTKKLICSIDPETARDLDDALSIEEVEPNIYEIGVHIADVGYFVREGDLVDEEARKRTTSVYLPHRVIPMLPGVLCEKLCSLNPGVERLAFSIFFKMNRNGVWLDKEPPRIAKSIIKSCGKLSYEVAQTVIEGKVHTLEEIPSTCKVNKSIDEEKFLSGIKLMNELAQKRRVWRMNQGGSLQFEKKKKRFKLNEDNLPSSFTIEERKEAHFLVEEYMLLANIIAGDTLVKNCREIALLRKHEFPQDKKIKALKTFLDSLNIKGLKTSDLFAIFNSIAELKESKQISHEILSTIDQKLIRTMQIAKYFIVDDSPEESWHHFALNFDVYTHFTSPIRRYPDVLVHRLLFNILEFGENARQHTKKETLLEIMGKCNECKQASRKVSDGCEKIFSCLCMKVNKFEVFTKAIVLSFGKTGISLSVPEYELLDLKINFKEVAQVREVSLEENPKKLILKISNSADVKDRKKKDKRKYYEQDDEEDEFREKSANLFMRRLELEVLQSIDVKLGVKDTFPIDYKVLLAIRNTKNELEVIV